MRKFTVLILSALLCWAPIVFIAGCSGGCTTSQKAVAYKTLAAVQQTVDSALKAYSEVLVAGKVDQATQIKVADAKAKYEVAFKAAVEAARGDLNTLTPENVKALADQLSTALSAVLK